MALKSLPLAIQENKRASKDLSEKEAQPHYAGHRSRLRERFSKAPQSLADYELIELLLFASLPRFDTKPLAKKLMATHKSLGALFAASYEKLTQTQGLGPSSASTFKLIQEIMVRALKENLQEKPLLSNMDQVIQYCRTIMAHLDIEQFRVLFLNTRGGLLKDCVMQEGTVDHAILYPREIVKKALDLGASSLIMVHNHPSGYAKPSEADKQLTTKMKELSKEMGLRLLDHLIIGKHEHFSFRAQGWF